MEIAFAKKSLRQLCESERRGCRLLGAPVTERLKSRLADFQAANCVIDLVAGRPREIESAQPGRMAIELGEGFQLIFASNHSHAPLIDGSRIDWSRVSRVKILSIERHYVRQKKI